MSYYRELKDFVLQLKGGFFLSPRDRWFLKFLEEGGYPLEVVREGIRRFFLLHPPEKRSKLPLHMSFGHIQKLRQLYTKDLKAGSSWKEKFRKKLSLAEELLGQKLHIQEPESMQEAEQVLQSLESELAKRLWEALSREEKKKLVAKFAVFKDREDLLKAMIKQELFKRKGIRSLSLFVD